MKRSDGKLETFQAKIFVTNELLKHVGDRWGLGGGGALGATPGEEHGTGEEGVPSEGKPRTEAEAEGAGVRCAEHGHPIRRAQAPRRRTAPSEARAHAKEAYPWFRCATSSVY
uniref:Uncharacterized protein n=1 Tax=Leersia perrieri TaxID=77586 RepID=A0A0D9X570_9ORYZ